MTTTEGKRAPRILLGVSGSVAAVKAPEIAVRLVTELQAHVQVLLSAGGQNFWEKAIEYDRVNWEKLQSLISDKGAHGEGPRIRVHCK